jgi:hypothetical protein
MPRVAAHRPTSRTSREAEIRGAGISHACAARVLQAEVDCHHVGPRSTSSRPADVGRRARVPDGGLGEPTVAGIVGRASTPSRAASEPSPPGRARCSLLAVAGSADRDAGAAHVADAGRALTRLHVRARAVRHPVPVCASSRSRSSSQTQWATTVRGLRMSAGNIRSAAPPGQRPPISDIVRTSEDAVANSPASVTAWGEALGRGTEVFEAHPAARVSPCRCGFRHRQ